MPDPEMRITVTKTGPYKVEGCGELRDGEEKLLETQEGQPFFLCRCGHSANKPFCDGSHNRNDWDSALAAR